MATMNEIAYSILETVRPNFSSSENISLDHIKFEIRTTAALIIKQELDKKQVIDPAFITDLGCLELEDVDRTICQNSGCYMKRTKIKLPIPLSSNQRTLLIRIGPIDRLAKSYEIVSYTRMNYLFNSKYSNKKTIYAFVMSKDMHVYIAYHCDNPDAALLEYINVMGVFPDTSNLTTICTDGDNCCDPDDINYGITEDLIPKLTDIVYRKFLITSTKPTDEVNNSKNVLSLSQKN